MTLLVTLIIVIAMAFAVMIMAHQRRPVGVNTAPIMDGQVEYFSASPRRFTVGRRVDLGPNELKFAMKRDSRFTRPSGYVEAGEATKPRFPTAPRYAIIGAQPPMGTALVPQGTVVPHQPTGGGEPTFTLSTLKQLAAVFNPPRQQQQPPQGAGQAAQGNRGRQQGPPPVPTP